MDETKLVDISGICDRFGVSSRTLRFYEEEGIIASTREEGSSRRKYSFEQIARIREVLTLRTIGISVKEIKEYLQGNASLKEIVHLRKAEIIASIESKSREIELLNQALMAMDDGENLFEAADMFETPAKRNQKATGNGPTGNEAPESKTAQRMEIVRNCAEWIIQDHLEKLYPYFSQQLREYMPESAFQATWRDCITGAGKFQRLGETCPDNESENVVLQKFHFEKVTVLMKFVFHNLIIHGLWTSFVE
ncbi:MAG: MerR family transcriptional regulator [Lachnospiraceae bacterium]|nr:MerR family transcriptional regulator [Lachnospiraceae bacterium]